MVDLRAFVHGAVGIFGPRFDLLIERNGGNRAAVVEPIGEVELFIGRKLIARFGAGASVEKGLQLRAPALLISQIELELVSVLWSAAG